MADHPVEPSLRFNVHLHGREEGSTTPQSDVVNDMAKSLLNESLADRGKVGLSPFYEANPAPAVSRPSE